MYQIYKYLVYIPWLLFWTFVNFVGVVIVAPFSQQKAGRWFARTWGKGLLMGVPAGLTIRGGDNLDPRQSYIVVANHLSLMDIPILYGWVKLDLKWVMKKELRKVPMIGGGCALLGHIFLDRANHQESLRELERFKARMEPGTSVMFFPEGTRSRDGQLKGFKMGAFRMAQDLDIPILPITIKGADAILTPDGMDLHPGRAEMIIHPAIGVEQVRSAEAEALRDQSHAQIASAL